MNKIKVLNLGLVDYTDALSLQKEFVQSIRQNKGSNILILMEHPPVITVGRNGKRDNIFASDKILKEKNIKIYEIARGGDVTLHCPGQLIGYPIIDLSQNGKDIHRYIRNLEEVILLLLKDYRIEGKRVDGYTGVWVGSKKIASIGIGIKHWITYHGFALNINPDMLYFSLINPCGMKDKKMTSISELLNQKIDKYELRLKLIKHFSEVFNLETKGTLPPWIKKQVNEREIEKINSVIADYNLHTVCQSAKCPNISECFSRNKVTFMILGNVCTRNCKFCSVMKGKPLPVDIEEPKRIADAVKKLQIKHVVITSVTRDDLPDGGAQQFVRTIEEIRNRIKKIIIEVLIPDFQGSKKSIELIVKAKPDIISHNIETVPELYFGVRPEASYNRSINLLTLVKNFAIMNPQQNILTKSGLMLGLGETKQEVIDVMQDLRKVDCDMFTLGQYLQPKKENLPVKEFILPNEFQKYKEIGEKMGFASIVSGPFVRSSYL